MSTDMIFWLGHDRFYIEGGPWCNNPRGSGLQQKNTLFPDPAESREGVRTMFTRLFYIIALLGACFMSCQSTPKGSIEEKPFGSVDGRPVYLYILKNGNGVTAKITNYGGIVTELHVPDRKGKTADVVLGFYDLETYLAGHPNFGAIVGRVANRIAKGKFTLDGKTYTLAVNNGPHHLHGGIKGFDDQVWTPRPLTTREGPALNLTYRSRDGEEGYPGNLTTTVNYTLTYNNELMIHINAETDTPTPVNVANHAYFNLAGHGSGDILKQEMMLNAEFYTPTDETLIPTGEIAQVKGTPYDFMAPKPIGRDIEKAGDDPKGYDMNFVINGAGGELNLAARARDPETGRVMEVFTTEPGVQFYTGNFLDGSLTGKDGAVYHQYSGFCLETQHYPDSINQPDWPSIVLDAGEQYHHVVVYRFLSE